MVLRAALEQTNPVTIFGTDYDTPDGTCISDHIHVTDLADAHILAMEQILTEDRSVTYNLGNGIGISVREIIRAAETVTGHPIHVVIGERRTGDPPVLVGDGQRAIHEMGWRPQMSDLQTILSSA